MRLATFNLKHGAKAAGYIGNPNKVAEIVQALDADILALQEVDKGTLRAKLADLAGGAASKAGVEHIFAPTLKFYLGEYGNALLVRGGIIDYEVLEMAGGHRFGLNLGGKSLRFVREPRNAILARVKVGDRELSVVSTHLSLEAKPRDAQMKQIMEKLLKMPAPRVLMGDLNMTPVEASKHLQDTGLTLVQSGSTYQSKTYQAAIDYIAVDGLAVVRSEVEQFDISDHRAVIAEVD